jgi:hypothetical protein
MIRNVFFVVLCLLALMHGQSITVSPAGGVASLTGTTGSIGGGALLAGTTTSGTATVTGATVGMACIAQASDGTNLIALGAQVGCTVTATNTVTVNVSALIALTPPAKTYSIRVIQ